MVTVVVTVGGIEVLPVNKTDRGTVVVEGKEYFPATMLAEMKIPDLPKSRAGIYKYAARKGWSFINIQGKGAKDGVRYFLVPGSVFAEPKKGIDEHQQGPSNESRKLAEPSLHMAYMARVVGNEEPQSGEAIDEQLLAACLAACRRVYGDEFDALSVTVQLGYAVDLYNLLVKMSAQKGGLAEMKRLELNGLVEQLNVFVRLGWPRRFPPPPGDNWFF